MIQAYILKRGKVTASGANMELRLLRALFNFGLNAELIASNPAAKIPFLPEAKSRRRHPPPKEDLIKVISVADPDTQDYLWALAFTAARVGEINALTWEDVDFERRLVTLWTRKRKNSNREPRDVPMVPNLYEILKSRYEQRNPNMPWVFWHTCYSSKKKQKVSGPYGDRKRVLATLCKKADVPYFSFHPIRHLTASLLDDLGVTMGVIQKILGHKNRRTTEIYLHSIGDSARRAMGLLGEQAFPGAASSNPEVPRNMPREYYQRKVERPSLEQLKKDIGNLGFVGTGKKYGVSDNAVRKWLRLELEPVNTADFLSSEKKSQSNSQSKEKRVNPERLTP
jgi:integrase